MGQLRDANGAVDLTNATSARLLRRPVPAGTIQDLPLTFDTPRTNGQVIRDWQTGDNAVATDYECEVEVTWNDGSIETFPNDSFYSMSVVADLG